MRVLGILLIKVPGYVEESVSDQHNLTCKIHNLVNPVNVYPQILSCFLPFLYRGIRCLLNHFFLVLKVRIGVSAVFIV